MTKRSQAAFKANETRGPAGRKRAAEKSHQTRRRNELLEIATRLQHFANSDHPLVFPRGGGGRLVTREIIFRMRKEGLNKEGIASACRALEIKNFHQTWSALKQQGRV